MAGMSTSLSGNKVSEDELIWFSRSNVSSGRPNKAEMAEIVGNWLFDRKIKKVSHEILVVLVQVYLVPGTSLESFLQDVGS